ENGHITYMRTDSTNMSAESLKAAQNYIENAYGKKYHHYRTYKTKNSSAQEAHEAIRPTLFDKSAAGADEQQSKLYQLIWKRAIASQMASARMERSEVTITISGNEKVFIAKGEV